MQILRRDQVASVEQEPGLKIYILSNRPSTSEIKSKFLKVKNFIKIASTYFQSISTAWHGCEDIVGVHWADHERGAVPGFGTVPTSQLGPTLKTTHAHRAQVLRLSFWFRLKQKNNTLRQDQWIRTHTEINFNKPVAVRWMFLREWRQNGDLCVLVQFISLKRNPSSLMMKEGKGWSDREKIKMVLTGKVHIERQVSYNVRIPLDPFLRAHVHEVTYLSMNSIAQTYYSNSLLWFSDKFSSTRRVVP